MIDLFAGPGGLGKGFAGLECGGDHPFRIVMSAESDPAAHAMLRLRAFVRAHLREEGRLPKGYAEYHAGRTSQLTGRSGAGGCGRSRRTKRGA